MSNSILHLTLLMLTAAAAAGGAQVTKGAKARTPGFAGQGGRHCQTQATVNEGVQVSLQVTGISAGTHAFPYPFGWQM